MKIKSLKAWLSSFPGKRNIITLGISLIIGVLIASALYIFTQHSSLKVKASDIIYVNKGPISPGLIHLSHTADEEFSFFINVYITQKQGQKGSFTVWADRINRISFLIPPDGVPCIRWKSKKILPPRNSRQGITPDRKVSRNQWNHVGFTYKRGKLTTFVNSQKCWEMITGHKKFILSHIKILPPGNLAAVGWIRAFSF